MSNTKNSAQSLLTDPNFLWVPDPDPNPNPLIPLKLQLTADL